MKGTRAAEAFKPYLGLGIHATTQPSTQPFSLLFILMFHHTLTTLCKIQTLHSPQILF